MVDVVVVLSRTILPQFDRFGNGDCPDFVHGARFRLFPLFFVIPVEQRLDLRCRVALEAWQDMGVGVHGRADLAVPLVAAAEGAQHEMTS
jgi:hypothetical protein